MLENGPNLSPWDVLSLGTLCPLGPFVSGTFCLWDVLSLGTCCPWDVLSWKVWSLGCLSLGRFVPGTFCMCIKNLNHMLEKQYVFFYYNIDFQWQKWRQVSLASGDEQPEEIYIRLVKNGRKSSATSGTGRRLIAKVCSPFKSI